jgi:para-aminobenzoate synthetase component I
MNRFSPVVGSLPRMPGPLPGVPGWAAGVCASARGVAERRRLQWRISDGGDPAALVEDFLAEAGLLEGNLLGRVSPAANVWGASIFLSAAAGAYLAGAPPGAPSPVPAIPDVVVVLFTDDGAAGEPVADPTGAGGGVGAGPVGAWRLGAWQDSWTPAGHADAVGQVRAAIARGDVYQVNVVGHASAPYVGDPMPALRRVAALPGARYGGVLTGDGWALACASPETLVSVAGRRVVTRPIKGTRPATAAGRRELLGSAKERAEHVMIVDLERNDLARVARTGSVRVDELYAVRRWCDLWQAESVVSAELAEGVGLAALLRAVCPGGSVTGAPKRAALEQIAHLEPVGRGVSMGALGWVGPDGVVDLGLSIRTVAVDGERAHVWAGGGITWGSDPAAEVAEAAAKAAPLRSALAAAGTHPRHPPRPWSIMG